MTTCNTNFYCAGTNGLCPTTCTTSSQCVFPAICGASNTCVVGKRIFVTSTNIAGDIGGVAQADAFCQTRAQAGGLPGTYKAWLSGGSFTAPVHARDRVTNFAGPYVQLNGTKVADSFADLTDGTLDLPIAITELGTQRSFAGGVEVYTGSDVTGAALPFNCLNWTSAAAPTSVVVGGWSYGSSNWTDLSRVASCAVTRPVYCLEQ